MTWVLAWLVLSLIATMILSRIMNRMKLARDRQASLAHQDWTPTSHPVKTKHGWQYLDEGKRPVDDKAYDAAFPIYTVLQVMERLPDDVRDMLRLAGPCSGPAQGHLWMPTVLQAEGKRWKCRFCPSVARTTAAASATGTLHNEPVLTNDGWRSFVEYNDQTARMERIWKEMDRLNQPW